MAVSSRLALLSLGTILLCFFLAGDAVADSDYDGEIHAVKHTSPAADCKGEHSDKGQQCREENDDVDDDFDDTYKMVNNVAVTLSASGRILQQTNTVTEAVATVKETAATATGDIDLEDNPSSEEEIGSLFVLGH